MFVAQVDFHNLPDHLTGFPQHRLEKNTTPPLLGGQVKFETFKPEQRKHLLTNTMLQQITFLLGMTISSVKFASHRLVQTIHHY